MVELLRESGDLVGEPAPITHPVKFFEKGDKPLEIVTTRQWYLRNGGRDAGLRGSLLERGRELDWHPAHMQVRYDELGRGPQRRLARSRRQRFFGVPVPVWYRAGRRRRTRCYDEPLCPPRTTCRSTRRSDAPTGLRPSPARRARRVRRRPRRDGHLGDLVADPADRRRLGARPRPVARGCSPWTCVRRPTRSSAPGCSPPSCARTSSTTGCRGPTPRSAAGSSTPTARR